MNNESFALRKAPVWLLFITLSFSLTNCSSRAPDVQATSPDQPVRPSATLLDNTLVPSATLTATAVLPTITPTGKPTETPIPTETATPFVPKATIKIASQSPLTGEYAGLGIDIMRGAELAVAQLSATLMELGYKIELVAYDDQNDIGVAVDNAKEIVADPEILCGVGNFSSRVFAQVKENYHQAGLAFVSPSATAAYVTSSGYLEVNRLLGRNDVQGAAGARFAQEMGYSRVFILKNSNDYAQFIAYHFKNEANRMGITIVGEMTTDAMEDFGGVIENILTSKADLVYFSGFADQGGAFFREARAGGYAGAFLGPDGLDNPSLLDISGPLLIDGGGMYYSNFSAQASFYPGAAVFIEDFERVYGSTPQMFSLHAYDAAGVCLKAIEEAAKAKDGEIPTRQEVALAIRALQDFAGITGMYNFNKDGDPNPARYFIFKVVSADADDWYQNLVVNSYEVAPPE